MINVQQHKRQIAHKILNFNSGPIILAASFIGFQVHLNLPVGSGRWGSTFGSDLPSPTGFLSAYAIGTNSKDNKICPVSEIIPC